MTEEEYVAWFESLMTLSDEDFAKVWVVGCGLVPTLSLTGPLTGYASTMIGLSGRQRSRTMRRVEKRAFKMVRATERANMNE